VISDVHGTLPAEGRVAAGRSGAAGPGAAAADRRPGRTSACRAWSISRTPVATERTASALLSLFSDVLPPLAAGHAQEARKGAHLRRLQVCAVHSVDKRFRTRVFDATSTMPTKLNST